MPTRPPAKATDRLPKDQRFNMRMSSQQRQLISHAAAALDKTETEFMLDVAMTRAERVLADRRWFLLDDSSWDEFEQLFDAPIDYEDDLRNLLRRPTVFGK